MENNHLAGVASQVPVASVGQPVVNPVNCLLTNCEQPGSQAGWVSILSNHSPKHKPPVQHQPLHISNRVSPVSNTSTDQTLFGSSILRNVKLAIVKCIPGARASKVESYLKLLAKANL